MKLKAITVGILFGTLSAGAFAQSFDANVSNPFAFCSGPKPCRKCQPWRARYEKLCPSGQTNNEQKAQIQQITSSEEYQSSAKSQDQIESGKFYEDQARIEQQAKSMGAPGTMPSSVVPLHQQKQVTKQTPLKVTDEVTVQVTVHQSVNEEVLRDKNGKLYRNDRVVSEVYEYNGRRFNSLPLVVAHVKMEMGLTDSSITRSRSYNEPRRDGGGWR